jgi:error-prone DNA polymerase
MRQRLGSLPGAARRRAPAVRLGPNAIDGMEEEACLRIEEARLVERFRDSRDSAARANLNAGRLNALADANGLAALAGNRRQALWQAVASVREKGLLRPVEVVEEFVALEAPTEAEDAAADYRTIGLMLGRHLLSYACSGEVNPALAFYAEFR